MNLTIALFVVGTLISILLAAITWIGNSMVTQLKSIAISVQRMEIDLGILNSDHHNLKSRVSNIEDDVKEIQRKKTK
jgi:uncharacterized protein YoxC